MNSFYPDMPSCNCKHNSMIGNIALDDIKRKWYNDNRERWDKVTKSVEDYEFNIAGRKLNISGLSPEMFAIELKNQYLEDLHNEFDGTWYESYVNQTANRALLRSETALEARDMLKSKIEPDDISDELAVYMALIIGYYNDMMDATAQSVEEYVLQYLYENPEASAVEVKEIILERQKKVGVNRSGAIIETQTSNVYNKVTIIYFSKNYVVKFKMVTNDPCPVCEALAQEDYTLDQVQEYQIAIDKYGQVTGYDTASMQTFYAANPQAGLIPVHVNCQCFWTIG